MAGDFVSVAAQSGTEPIYGRVLAPEDPELSQTQTNPGRSYIKMADGQIQEFDPGDLQKVEAAEIPADIVARISGAEDQALERQVLNHLAPDLVEEFGISQGLGGRSGSRAGNPMADPAKSAASRMSQRNPEVRRKKSRAMKKNWRRTKSRSGQTNVLGNEPSAFRQAEQMGHGPRDPQLAKEEVELLTDMLQTMTPRQVADDLGIGYQTVMRMIHQHNILAPHMQRTRGKAGIMQRHGMDPYGRRGESMSSFKRLIEQELDQMAGPPTENVVDEAGEVFGEEPAKFTDSQAVDPRVAYNMTMRVFEATNEIMKKLSLAKGMPYYMWLQDDPEEGMIRLKMNGTCPREIVEKFVRDLEDVELVLLEKPEGDEDQRNLVGNWVFETKLPGFPDEYEEPEYTPEATQFGQKGELPGEVVLPEEPAEAGMGV
jgi:hypothetical protein